MQSPRDPRLPPGVNMPPPGIYFPHPPYGLGPETGHIDGTQWAAQRPSKNSSIATAIYSVSIFLALVTGLSVFLPWLSSSSGFISLEINGLNQIGGTATGFIAAFGGNTSNPKTDFPIAGIIVLIAATLVLLAAITGIVAQAREIAIAVVLFSVVSGGIFVWRFIDGSIKINDAIKANPSVSGTVSIGYGLYIGFAAVLITVLVNMYLLFQD